MSQFSDTKVANQKCHMEHFDEKLMESSAFADHNLAHSIRILVCNKRYPHTVCYMKLWITGPNHVYIIVYSATRVIRMKFTLATLASVTTLIWDRMARDNSIKVGNLFSNLKCSCKRRWVLR